MSFTRWDFPDVMTKFHVRLLFILIMNYLFIHDFVLKALSSVYFPGKDYMIVCLL